MKRRRRIRHTKIVCTLGPATDADGVLHTMVMEGMNVARLNLSHANHEDHAQRVQRLRDVMHETGRWVAVLADLQGPKVRLGGFDGAVELQRDALIEFVPPGAAFDTNAGQLPVGLDGLAAAVSVGGRMTLADGTIRLMIEAADTASGVITCRVVDGGSVLARAGLSVPGAELDIPSITEKDRRDLTFALDLGVDFVAQSFVRNAHDVAQLRELIAEHHPEHEPQLIAKIETEKAVRNLNEIMAAADAVMVARGDLGVELGAADVPLVQKRIIKRANRLGIPVITATQMLETMTTNPEPTRAEASDVANAIIDGTSAVMLSGETAIGRHPVQVVKVMDQIARAVEPSLEGPRSHIDTAATTSIPEALSVAACEIGELLSAAALLVLTETGNTARRVSKHRPRRPLIAASRSPEICRRLALYWGAVPVLIRGIESTETYWQDALEVAWWQGLVEPHDRIVLTAGTILHQPGVTNMLKVEEFMPRPGTTRGDFEPE